MRVAIVHDWLTGMRGGERCLETFLSIYPRADVYTLFHVRGSTSAKIDQRVVQSSPLNRLPKVRRYYRALLPLFPWAIKSLRIPDRYDLVISLSHAAAKNVVVPPGAKHICYCFTPMRYIWDQAESYFGRAVPVFWPVLSFLRRWDCAGSASVDRFVAISNFVAARIRRFYSRPADVIFPPVDTGWISSDGPSESEKAFLYAGALVPYKRVELILEAFEESGLPLWVAGSGPLERLLRKRSSKNIRFFGRVSDQKLASLYKNCRALVFAAREDFGMIPVECLSAGRPVIACYDGALKESMKGIRPWSRGPFDFSDTTGVYFQSPRLKGEKLSLLAALEFFLQHEGALSSEACTRHARTFSADRFRREWEEVVSKVFDPEDSHSFAIGKYAQAKAATL